MLTRNGPPNYRICLLTNLCRVVALHAVFVAHCFLDAVYLLLVAALVFHCPFLGFLQCTLQANRNAVHSKAKRTFVFFSSNLPLRQRPSSVSNLAIVSLRVLFFSFSFSNFFFHCSAVNSRFTDAVFLIVLMRGQDH
uniref:Transmembrane protein n=1 Tax=Naja naja TaxID=35670 RepID=A0A8C6Y3Z2_NAJNA